MNPIFEEYLPFYGFDKSANPHWQMVPSGNDKKVYLMNAANLPVEIKDSKIAQVTEVTDTGIPPSNKRLFQIRGLTHGKTFLEVRQDNSVKVRLEISVKKLLKFRLGFNFLVSGRCATKKDSSQASRWVRQLNEIYAEQTNVFFDLGVVNTISPTSDFGPELDFTDADFSGWEWETMVSNGDQGSDINIFLVKKINYFIDQRNWNSPKGATWKKDCCVGDEPERGEEAEMIVIAHEIGHALGIPGEKHFYHRKNRNQYIMFWSSKFLGRGIPKIHAETINP